MIQSRLSKVVVGLLILLFVLSGCAPKPKVAQVLGSVTRTGGTPLVGAEIIIGEAAAGVDAEGNFTVEDVPFGTHNLIVKMGTEEVSTTSITISDRKPVTVPKITADPSGGVIYAQDFEINIGGRPYGWTNFSANSGNGGAYTTAKVYEGTTAWLLTGSDKNLDGIRTIRIPAVPGKEYTFSFYYIAEVSGCTPYLDFLDAAGKRVEAPRRVAAVASDWTLFTISGIAPEGTVYVAPFFYYATDSVRTTYIDNVKIVEADAAP